MKRLVRDRQAAVSIVVGVTILALALSMGLAIDATRLWMVRTALQKSVDAAALLAATEIGSASQAADAQKLFWVNFSRNGYSAASGSSNAGFMGATSGGATVTQVDSSHVQVTAQANVSLTIMGIGGSRTASIVAANAIAQQAGTYEIALALDVTGSMLNSADASTTKIQAVKNAVASMLSVVYGPADTSQGLSFAVVPFRGSVNMNPQNQGWLNQSAYKPANWSAQAWRGCIEARLGGYDLTEDSPNTRAFNPLYWISTYQAKVCSGNSGGCMNGYYPGDNDWTAGSVTDDGNGAASSKTWSGLPAGPNLGCSNEVVLPLTASKGTISTKVNNMVAASGGSTVLSQGLQWSWFTLSPLWQSSWGLAAAQNGSPRPLSYSTPNNHKVIILMTDGNDEWDGNETAGTNANCGKYKVWPECVQTDGYYNSYGRLSSNHMTMAMPAGTPPSSSNTASLQAASSLDTLTSQTCTAIKNKGVIIYTIAFQAAASSTAETVLKSCATDSSHYYNTNTGQDINNAFISIAQSLQALRLTQ